MGTFSPDLSITAEEIMHAGVSGKEVGLVERIDVM